jgi:hypothetical protein
MRSVVLLLSRSRLVLLSKNLMFVLIPRLVSVFQTNE